MSDSKTNFPDGIVLLDKKPGITSMASDNFIKKVASTRKVGHSGTLDPFATGLLPIFVGKALRVMRYTDDYDKAYYCVAKFGFATDTMDCLGEMTEGHAPSEEEIKRLKEDDFKLIRDAFLKISESTEQIPPKYSAKKINGRKAYELAREGIEVELKPNKIKIYSIDIKDISVVDGYIHVSFDVECSKGTYIRTICDDAGKLTGFGAHAIELRRTKCGPFSIDDAITEESIKERVSSNDYSFVLNETSCLKNMPTLSLNEREFKAVKVGKKIIAPVGTEFDKKYVAYYGDKLAAVLYKANEDGKDLMRIDRMLAND